MMLVKDAGLDVVYTEAAMEGIGLIRF